MISVKLHRTCGHHLVIAGKDRRELISKAKAAGKLPCLACADNSAIGDKMPF